MIRSAVKGYVINDTDVFRDDLGRLVFRQSAYRRIRHDERRRKRKAERSAQICAETGLAEPESERPPFEFLDGKTVRYGPGETDVFTLPPKPYEVLKYLCSCKNLSAHYDDLAANVWGEADYDLCGINDAIDKRINPTIKNSGYVVIRKNKIASIETAKGNSR